MYIPTSALPGLRVVEEIHIVRPGRPPISQEERHVRSKVGAQLKLMRRKRLLTMRQCADALGIRSSTAIGAIESGAWHNEAVIRQYIRYLATKEE